MNKLILVLILLILALKGRTQQNLSVREAIFFALENNYQMQIAEKQNEIALKNNTWSEAGLFPTVSLSAGISNQIQDNRKNVFTFTPGLILLQSLSPTLSANWNIFAGFNVKISKERLQLIEDQSKGNALAVLENTTQDVIKAYFTAVLQKKRLELFKTVLDLSSKKLKYIELKDKYARSNSLDLLQIKNQLLTDSSNFLMQQLSYQNALRNLGLIMNVPTEKQEAVLTYRLTDSLNYSLKLINLSEAQNEMLQSNQNISNQLINIELQRKAVELQKSFLYPTLSLQTGVSPNINWLKNIEMPEQQFQTQQTSYYANLNLRYTIFNNWKTQRAVQVGKIQSEIAELTKESIEQTLKSTLSNLIDLYNLRTQLLLVSEENISYARRMIDLAEKRYELGGINSMELLTIQNSYQSTLTQHFENQFNSLDTYLEIYKITGKLGLEYQK
jgi:outer membrane protein TolC